VTMKAKGLFWDRIYTRKELMRDSRWFLLFVGLINVGFGLLCRMEHTTIEKGNGIIALGCIDIVFSFLPFFWPRFVCVAIFVADHLTTDLYSLFIVLRQSLADNNFLANGSYFLKARIGPMVFMTIGSILLYKMWKYRNNNGEGIIQG